MSSYDEVVTKYIEKNSKEFGDRDWRDEEQDG